MTARQLTRLRVGALGVVVPLEVHGDELSEAVADVWSASLIEHDAEQRADRVDAELTMPPVTVAVGLPSRAELTGGDVAEVLLRLPGVVVQRAIAARAGELVLLHAAALADPRTGATAVLVAPPGAGLTTAATTLGRDLACLTDETTGVAPDGTVLSALTPLSIIGPDFVRRQMSPRALALVPVEHTCRLATLLILDRDPAHLGEPEVVPLETIDALAALAGEAIELGRLDRPLQRLADVVRQAGGARRVIYAEADTLGPLIRELLGATHR